MKSFVRFLLDLNLIDNFFKFLILVILFFRVDFAYSYEGNLKIKNFDQAKKILNKIHNENPVTFYCGCKYSDKKPDWQSCGFTPLKDKKRASRVEWEHVLPASHFGIEFDTWKNGHVECVNKKGKKFKGRKCANKINSQYRFMQADLYNLQPAIGEINGLRSNYQIGLIEGEERDFGRCDIEFKNKNVEPMEKIRGDIARTYMYMEQSYPQYVKFESSLKKLLIKWDKDDPVDNWECKRAEKIFKIQGNLNQIITKRCNKIID